MKKTSKIELRIICRREVWEEVADEVLNALYRSERFQKIRHRRSCKSTKNNIDVLLYFDGDYIRGDISEESTNTNSED